MISIILAKLTNHLAGGQMISIILAKVITLAKVIIILAKYALAYFGKVIITLAKVITLAKIINLDKIITLAKIII